MNNSNTLAPRVSFTRIGKKSDVTRAVNEAVKAGGTATKDSEISIRVVDNTAGENKFMFKAVLMRPGMWVITYSTAYYPEN